MELATTLSTWHGRQAFDEQLAALLRTADFAQADADLTGWLSACPSRLAEICLGIGADSVTIAGWDQLHADFLKTEQSPHFNQGQDCTAVNLGLINRQSIDRLLLQPRFYNENEFPTGCADRDVCLAQLDTSEAGQGRGYFPGKALDIFGLELLVRTLRASQHLAVAHETNGGVASNDYIGLILADWFLMLRVQQAIARDLAIHGMPRPVPVFVGVDRVDRPMEVNELDYGVFFRSVYLAPANDTQRVAAAEILRLENEASRTAYQEATEKIIDDFRFRRKSIRGWWRFINPSKRRLFIEYAQTQDELMALIWEQPIGEPTWKMHNSAFEAFIRRVREWREARQP